MEKHRDRLTRGLFRRSPANNNQKEKDNASSARQQHHRSGRPTAGDSHGPRECACGRGMACTGMTQAFRLLGDPRCYYVELPRYRENPPAYKYVFRNNLRAAYVRHLKKSSPALDIDEFDTHSKQYVALHHFHPAVVKAFHANPLTSAQKHKVPISITEHELRDLNMDICEDDRILSVNGAATGGYYFVPGYSHESAHDDLKNLIRGEREAREKAKRDLMSKLDPDKSFPMQGNSQVSSVKDDKETLEARRAAVQRTVRPAAAASSAQSSVGPATNSAVEPSKPFSDADTEAPKTANDDTPTTSSEEKAIAQIPAQPDKRDDAPIAHEDKVGVAPSNVQSDKRDEDSHDKEEEEEDTTKHDDDDDSTEPITVDQSNEDGEFDTLVADSTATEFDSLWADDSKDEDPEPSKPIADGDSSLSNLDKSTPVIVESENEDTESSERELSSSKRRQSDILGESALPAGPANPTTPTRETDHPWDTPKYRRKTTKPELSKTRSSGPATFIDPSVVSTPTKTELKERALASSEPIEEESTKDLFVSTADAEMKDMEKEIPPAVPVSTPDLKSDGPGVLAPDPPAASSEDLKRQITPKQPLSPPRTVGSVASSDDSLGESFAPVALRHPVPGTDPTMRIQVHNELIAWESKRRSSLAHSLEFNREQWKAAREILRCGVDEVEYAERLVLGFAKAGVVFAESLQAIHDDKLLDDAGNTVSNSFMRNRLQKQRQVQEYSIDKNQAETVGEGESALLNSLIHAQVELATTIRESSQHMEEEILVEIADLRASVQARAREIETVGDGILGELKRSEGEVKNIWDVFDAMVTGDLMEYSTHGSMHGSFHGSMHSGSAHGGSFGSLHTPLSHSSSVHGFSTEGASPIISSLNSPLVKNMFRQLGNLEDGWLIETHYKTAVTYQMKLYKMATEELENLFGKIISLEEDRFRKLHQIMLAFVPRQQRLYTALPRQLKGVLDDLVGLRIDEESLQSVVDQAIMDRSHNHLKLQSTHRSSIMNRSRIKSVAESPDEEVQDIESNFGSPFDSSMILVSTILELKPGGLGGMVNANWKMALSVVTSGGNFYVFELPKGIDWMGRRPDEAFRALYPSMKFDAQTAWVAARKDPIVKSLTPTIALDMRICDFTVSNMRKRQFDVVEDTGTQKVGSRFLKAVNAGSLRPTRCTLRLATASDTSEWVARLEKAKVDIGAKKSPEKRMSRFRF